MLAFEYSNIWSKRFGLFIVNIIFPFESALKPTLGLQNAVKMQGNFCYTLIFSCSFQFEGLPAL
jgi:hypothetical protein